MDVISVIPDENMRLEFIKSLQNVKLSEKNSQFVEQIKIEIIENKSNKNPEFDK